MGKGKVKQFGNRSQIIGQKKQLEQDEKRRREEAVKNQIKQWHWDARNGVADVCLKCSASDKVKDNIDEIWKWLMSTEYPQRTHKHRLFIVWANQVARIGAVFTDLKEGFKMVDVAFEALEEEVSAEV